MIKAYEAIIERDALGYSVTFPDVPGCTTQGIDLQDAYIMAYDALGLMLQELLESGEAIPEPIYGHDAPEDGSIAVIVVNTDALDFTEEYVTVGEAADMLGVSSQRIQALIRSADIASRKVGTSRMINQDSVIDYRNRRDGAGRPRKAATS